MNRNSIENDVFRQAPVRIDEQTVERQNPHRGKTALLPRGEIADEILQPADHRRILAHHMQQMDIPEVFQARGFVHLLHNRRIGVHRYRHPLREADAP